MGRENLGVGQVRTWEGTYREAQHARQGAPSLSCVNHQKIFKKFYLKHHLYIIKFTHSKCTVS